MAWDGGLTLVAPLVAIGLAIATRRVIPSLVAAVAVAALVVAQGSLVPALQTLFTVALGVVADIGKVQVSAFSMLVAATVGVMGASGGTYALVGQLERFARGRRGAMGATAAAGTVVFFDDYANCMVVGSAMGPLCDRHGVSRAKLAYIVDSTAAPIASLAVVSTWVAYEVSLFSEAFAGTSIDGFSYFLQALPYRFYCILTLVFVFSVAWSGRDFGPMRRVEQDALSGLKGSDAIDVPTHGNAGPWHAAIPILVLVVTTFGWLLVDGWTSLGDDAPSAALFTILGAGDAFFSMFLGSTAAFAVAVVMAVGTRAVALGAIPRAAWGTVRDMLSALVVLYLAWILGDLIKETNAAPFIGGVLQGQLSPMWLPAGVFVVSALTAFSTGSSFFTMSALIPLAMSVAMEMEGAMLGPVLLASGAAVLDGAVLGDHASPISDTTILSSVGAGTDVVTHVRTQLPYALTVGVVTLAAGSIPAGQGAPPVVSIAIGAAACVAIVMLLGHPPAGSATDDP